MRVDLSIIIVNFNTKDLLEKCLSSILKSLKKTKLDFEMIVVDNGSRDGSIEYLENLEREINRNIALKKYRDLERKKTKSLNLSTAKALKVIFNNRNLGFGRANNQALGKVRGDNILLLNSDTEVINEGIEILLKFMQKNEQVDIVGGKLFNKDGTPQPSCGPFYSLPIIFFMLFLKGDKLHLTRWSPRRVREVDWVSGACLMAKRRVFEKLQFDENIFLYMDEIEFLYRAKKVGFRVFFCPEAHFFHVGAASSQDKKTPVLNIYQGLTFFYKKHYPGWQLFLLKMMLKIKAILAYLLGFLVGDQLLKKTYAKAFMLVR